VGLGDLGLVFVVLNVQWSKGLCEGGPVRAEDVLIARKEARASMK